MFIPPSNYKPTASTKIENEQVQLKSSHVVLQKNLVQAVCGENQNILLVFYPNPARIMMASPTDEIFKGMHKTSKRMLKNRNTKGDKSVAIHELLIDNEIDDMDRTLSYNWEEKSGILQVKL